MPRPSWVDDLDVLDAIESALSPEERAVLHDKLDEIGIERDAWLDRPALAQVFSVFAFYNVTRELESGGLSQEEAKAKAADRLRIPVATLRNRLRRWLRPGSF